MNVTDQFKFMHVSGDTTSNEKHVEELARSFMTTLGINANDAKHSDQLEALTKQMSAMMKQPSGSSSNSDQVHNINQNHSASNGMEFLLSGMSQMSQSPKAATEVPSQSPQRNNDSTSRGRSPSRHRSRSRTPIGARLKKAVDGIRRSKSPFRRNKDRSRSPIPMSRETSADNINMATDAEDDEFFETHSSMDSFMANSPIPRQAQKPSKGRGSNYTEKRSPTPLTFGRPPLATHNGNSPIISPQKQSTFKFDKEQDKFSVGVSPPKKSKFGSPGKKVRSPPSMSKMLTSPIVQPNHQPDMSPLQGSPLSEAGNPSPSPFQSSGGKPQTNNAYPSSQAMGGAPPLFASPVPDLFHAPDTFIRSSGTRGIPSPHNIMQNDPQPDDATRRQTAPPNMSTAATAAAAAESEPKTPFDRSQATTSLSETAPNTADTAETLIKKKTRNTATPNLDATSPIFNVDLSRNTNATKGKGIRGSTLRKGFNNGYASTKNTGSTGFVFGLDEIKEVGTDDTAPTAAESPSAGSAVSMDTSPFFSPPPQRNKQSRMNTENGMSQGFNVPAQFSLGVAGKLSQPGMHGKFRSKRNENKGRRSNAQRSQSVQVSGPSGSTFDLNHDRIALEEALSKSRSEIAAFKDLGKSFYVTAKYQDSTLVYSKAIEKFKLELFARVPNKDLLAMLLSNRAAALLMIGAYESAVEDSRNGIHYVTDLRNKNARFASEDTNPALRPKLYLRMGRSYLKLGKVDDAERAFSEAVESATVIQDFLRRQNIVGIHDALEQIKTDAIFGRTDIMQLRKLLGNIKRLEEQRSVNPKSARDQAMESLGLVKIALSTSDGCYELHHTKVKLLAELKRWREVCSHCERFAASNVKFDGCLVGDLSSKNPFPGVSVAKNLRANYFGDTKEDELKGAEMRLDRTASAEALLRLPCSMMPYYLRSLRLNERYVIAENCISKLEKYIRERVTATTNGASIHSQFLWLSGERDKLRRTRYERELADNMFSNADYEKAALRYAECLSIDSGGDQGCTGGRLHAILHCNRAACFMALKRFKEAMSECTAALRIYPRYLKALLRRARCYSRLDRHRETENDFKHWLEIVRQSRGSKSNPLLGDCVFDGPHTVKEKDIKDVQAELHDFLQAKARAEEEERARKARNIYQEQSRKYHSERFHYDSSNKQPFGKKSPAHEDAHRRRENFYSGQDSSRRWDSFKDRTQHSKEEKPKSRKNNKDEFGYKSQSKAPASAGSPRDNKDHYSVLGINRRATDEEIKKAYKKMALKYHPDKNKDCPTAADNFLRIKDAYEILKEPSARRKYDSKSRRGRY